MRKLPFLGLLSALSVALVIPTAMAEPELSHYDDCIDRSNANTMAMIDCARAELERLDAALNANYRALLPLLDEKRRKELKEVQRAWIRFRDLNCAFWDDPEGGQAARLAAYACYMEMTAARAQELRALCMGC